MGTKWVGGVVVIGYQPMTDRNTFETGDVVTARDFSGTVVEVSTKHGEAAVTVENRHGDRKTFDALDLKHTA